MPAASSRSRSAPRHVSFEVELPAGGKLELQDAEEVALWEEASRRYIEDYGFVRTNDLVLLGAILSQTIAMYRAQRQLADATKAGQAVTLIGKASEQIRGLEQALGVDKKSREAGGQHTVADYVTRLKRAAHMKGVRISERVTEMEALFKELEWKIRVLRNADDEDRRHHGISEKSIVADLEKGIADVAERDKEWAREKGAIFIGNL